MTELFDRKIFFDSVRGPLFQGSLTQQQVDGMNATLADWEGSYMGNDLRWLAYPMATSKHETASTMWPIEEYGKGAGQPYGEIDPKTGQAYYGRGLVQLTWDYNYKTATAKLELRGADDLYYHPDRALDPFIAGHVMFRGMMEGWFRGDSAGRQTLARYFDNDTDDAYMAREIINGDRKTIPSWSNGVSIGNLIKGYHEDFLRALEASIIEEPAPPKPNVEVQMLLDLKVAEGVTYAVYVNGMLVTERIA